MEDTYVLNTLDKEVHFKALGNHFSMKPGQIKRFNADMGDFISKEKSYLGLVSLTAAFDDPDYKNSEEGKALIAEKTREGKERRAQHLQAQVNNLTISMARDLSQANIKVDALTQATKGDIAAMEELRDLQKEGQDEEKKKLEDVRKLQRQLMANSNATANKN